jgi:hypothetical protein
MLLSSPHRRHRTLVVAAVAILVLGAMSVACVVTRPSDLLRSDARRQWKDRAIAAIDRRLDDKQWLTEKLAGLKSTAATKPLQGGWVGDELLLAKNGDWIICQNICAKDQHTSVRKDLFIGRGSDGKWYYSTFHFCVAKCTLLMERQPDTLAQFADAYWLVPFDPKSDECLNVTWNGGPYGDEKLQFRVAH